MRRSWFLACLGVAVLSGCDVGSSDDDDGGPIIDAPPADEESILCTAELAMSGTFTAAAALNPQGGCQPAGTWVVNVAVSSMGNCTAVPVLTSYTYTVTAGPDGRTEDITYSSGSNTDVRLQISASGGGECTASFEHITPNGAMFNEIDLFPRLPEPTSGGTTLAIAGSGTYNLWPVHP